MYENTCYQNAPLGKNKLLISVYKVCLRKCVVYVFRPYFFHLLDYVTRRSKKKQELKKKYLEIQW